LGDLAAHVEKSEERAAVLDAAEGLEACPRLPRPLRPIQVLAALARRSLRRGGTPLLDGPHAALLAMRVGITGR
jgi:phytoene synthase